MTFLPVLLALLFVGCLTAEAQYNNAALPVTYVAKVVDGSNQACPPEEQREMVRAEIDQEINDLIRNTVIPILNPCPGIGQSEDHPAASCLEIFNCNLDLASDYYWIATSGNSETAVQMYCDLQRQCACSDDTGGWTRVAYLNMTDPTHNCPSTWREITRTEDPKRTCGRSTNAVGCNSASFSSNGLSYSRVCGKIVGYQWGTTDAFYGYSQFGHTTLGSPYVDGVSLTHGTSPMEHIWTFAAALDESDTRNTICPCTNINSPTTVEIPPFVGQDYFCETGVPTGGHYSLEFMANDKLWDGQQCGPTSTCCELNDPPYFCKQLSEGTTDDIEVRICGVNTLVHQDVPVELIEIFVQ